MDNRLYQDHFTVDEPPFGFCYTEHITCSKILHNYLKAFYIKFKYNEFLNNIDYINLLPDDGEDKNKLKLMLTTGFYENTKKVNIIKIIKNWKCVSKFVSRFHKQGCEDWVNKDKPFCSYIS
jgi:hypothetical protein